MGWVRDCCRNYKQDAQAQVVLAGFQEGMEGRSSVAQSHSRERHLDMPSEDETPVEAVAKMRRVFELKLEGLYIGAASGHLESLAALGEIARVLLRAA